MRILIVDDSIVMRRFVERAIRCNCLNISVSAVVHAANGKEGLAALEAAEHAGAPFQLILCDLHMPIMDGPRFLLEKQQRNLATGVSVVMISADKTDPRLLQAVASGAAGFISKPFTEQQIQSTVCSRLRPAI